MTAWKKKASPKKAVEAPKEAEPVVENHPPDVSYAKPPPEPEAPLIVPATEMPATPVTTTIIVNVPKARMGTRTLCESCGYLRKAGMAFCPIPADQCRGPKP